MVTDKQHRMRNPFPAGLLLLVVAGIAGWTCLGWAGQQPAAKKPAPKTAAPAKKAAKAPAVRKAQAPVPTPSGKGLRAELSPGRRDPFLIPVYKEPTPGQMDATPTGPLPPGNRGLVISQLMLLGIVRLDTTQQMIAVVTNFTKRAYFLRVNDALYNGVVSKITPDSVYFQENTLDSSGRVVPREVVKRLGPAPGEGR